MSTTTEKRKSSKRKGTSKPARPTRDVAAELTAQIIAELDAGTVPWSRPWAMVGGQRNAQSGRPYRGINQLILGMVAESRDYADPRWMTFAAAKKAGGCVRKGERGQLITLWKRVRFTDSDATSKTYGEKIERMWLKGYTVFNVEQIDGVTLKPIPEPEHVDPIAAGEKQISDYLAADGPTLRHGGDSAYYQPGTDHVQLPERDGFTDSEAYYRVAFHELTHSTGAAKRLDRPEVSGPTYFGSTDYSREELTAELGAGILCGVAGILVDVPQSASYIAGWRRKLSEDNQLIVQAAGKAQRAADHVLGVSFADSDQDQDNGKGSD